MPIKNVVTSEAGLVNTLPSVAYISTTDTEAQILATGYLNQVVKLGTSFQMPCMACVSTLSAAGAQPDVGWYEVQNNAGVWSLITTVAPGSVTLPTISNHIATYTNVNGGLGEDATTAINGGNIQAGLSGTAGFVASFPTTAAKGSLHMTAVANTGNTITTVSNAAMGQASVVSIPDPGAATANFLLDHGTNTLAAGSKIVANKVNGTEAANAVTASGMAGLLTTSALTTAAAGSYAITWTNTFISASSVVLVTLSGGTNTTESVVFKVVPGAGSATLTIYNVGPTNALNGTILLGYLVM